MNNQTCEHCAGEGLIGAGENPIAKVGPLTRCPKCSGTGKINTMNNENQAPESVEEVSAPEAAPEQVSNESFLGESGAESASEAPAEVSAEAPAEAAPEEVPAE